MQPVKTEAIKRFLQSSTYSDLAELYNHDMEVQVNVAQDGGQRIEGDYKGRQWHGWSDGLQTWKPIRIPWNAATNPEYSDSPMTFDLAEHAEGVGMTGWDWKNKLSLWVGFDFDKITEHVKGLTDTQLAEVEAAAFDLPWTTIRKSTSGNGRHIYVFLTPTHTSTHTEHAALARSILGTMSALTGFDFHGKIDVAGGNMWVWHRKQIGTQGLTLIKQGSVFTALAPNWRDHIPVISGRKTKATPQFVDEENEDLFAELTGQRPKVKLDEEHKKLIEWLKDNNAYWWWDSDYHMLVTHTIYLKEAHEELGLKGPFKTLATGKDRGNDINAFLHPLRNGAWVVKRYTPGVAEESTWDQDSHGYTRCFLNRLPNLSIAARANEGIEHPSGGYVFRYAEQAQQTAIMLGGDLGLPTWAAGKKAKLKEHKDGRLIAEVEKEADDEVIKDWLPDGRSWKKIIKQHSTGPEEPEIGNADEIVRHLVTQTRSDYGWVYRDDDGAWHEEPFLHVKTALKGKGWSTKEVDVILGNAISRAWTIVKKPFQSEYPGGREWNKDAPQFRYRPTEEHDNLHYPHWLKILDHIGKGLDEAVQRNEWAINSGLKTGADYLKCWIASLFQYPEQPLPYLFLYGDQNCGKSILHEAIRILVTTGVDRVDNALKSQFNGELENLFLCIIEETNLRRNKDAYNKIKDWVTSRTIQIRALYHQPFSIPNMTHYIQVSNEFDACPILHGDTRITMIEVGGLTEIIPKKVFEKSLEKEAPDFLASILSLEIPASPDRLNIPVIETEQKFQLERANLSYIEAFINEQMHEVTGEYVLFSEFVERFHAWVGPAVAQEWSKIKISRELPPRYPSARLPQTGYKAIGNVDWEPKNGEVKPKYVVRNNKLVLETQ